MAPCKTKKLKHQSSRGRDGESRINYRNNAHTRLQKQRQDHSFSLLPWTFLEISFLRFYFNGIENSCKNRRRAIMIEMDTGRAPPRALSIFHRLVAPPEPRRGMPEL